ncbi:MAG TPA: YbaY family lipoprotein [bacterium]
MIVVRATITVGGRLLFTTTSAQRVITGGYPTESIEIVVQPVR